MDADEHPLFDCTANLFEPLPGRRRYQSTSNRVRVPLGRHVSWSMGGSQGTSTPVPEQLTQLDQGMVMVTDKRVLFLGPSQSRAWPWPAMVSMQRVNECAAVLHTKGGKRAAILDPVTSRGDFLRFLELGSQIARFGPALTLAHLQGAGAPTVPPKVATSAPPRNRPMLQLRRPRP